MTDSPEDIGRRQALKAIAAAGVATASAGCAGRVRERVPEDLPFIGGNDRPEGGGAPETPASTPTETPTPEPGPEYGFPGLENAMTSVETDPSLKEELGPVFDAQSLELSKEMLEEKGVEDAERWGLYATINVTDVGNWDDLDGIYNAGERGRRQLRRLLDEPAWDIFDTIDRYAGDMINRRQVNSDGVYEVGILFQDDEGEQAGYITHEEELEEIYSAESLEQEYKSRFHAGFELNPFEEG